MKIVFFGSSKFAVHPLDTLANSQHEVACVVTQPDRKKGRRLLLSRTPVKSRALELGLEIYQPEDLREKDAVKYIRRFKADLFVVAAYGEILTKEILDLPKLYAINVHPSLLPKYRGAAPVQWAMIKGEKKTGLTVIRMNEKMDAGDIMLERSVKIEREDTASGLEEKLSYLGAILLLDAVRFIEMEKIQFKRQNPKSVSYAPKLKKEDGLIDWGMDAAKVYNRVRGLAPWPGAHTLLSGKGLKILQAEILPAYKKLAPGTIIETRSDGIVVACGKNSIVIKELQLEGGKSMDAANFLRGHKLERGNTLGTENAVVPPPPPPPPEPEPKS
ncbi:MAG: methionyl-tRNA formyltransferase [Candidatus Omnitrophica bacterium]|nr:methionyl-tRNA formyltransferase [Candidatus Omnitrophota bacterium]